MTRRQVGWAYVGVGAAVLAAWGLTKVSAALAERSLARMTPEPVATIDQPRAGAVVGEEVVVEGTAVHETIRAPLWLLSSEGGRDWEPEGEIATGSGTWREEIWLTARKGTHVRLAVVAAELPLHNAFKQQKLSPDRTPWMFDPEWRRALHERWLTASVAEPYPPLPAAARVVTFVDVVQGENEPFPGVSLPTLLRAMNAKKR